MGIADPVLRAFENGVDRHRRVGSDRDERGVRPILQEAPHQISEKIAVAADWSIDPTGRLWVIGEQEFVKRLAHAVETLELIAFNAAGILDHACYGERIVGGELRIKPRPRRKQLARASRVAEISHRLAREHRIVGKAALLRTLDFGIPVGALDQPHRQSAPQPACGFLDPVDQRRRALLISLHGQRESVPTAQRAVGEHRCDDIKSKLEPISLLCVHGETEAMFAGLARKLEHLRHELGENEVARDRLEAGMQGGKLDGNARTVRAIAGMRGDGVNGMGVGAEIALGISSRARPLP